MATVIYNPDNGKLIMTRSDVITNIGIMQVDIPDGKMIARIDENGQPVFEDIKDI